jgi:DNA-binding CsgD family transcriptional regulator
MSSEPVKRAMPVVVATLLPLLSELRDAIVVFDSTGHWLYGNPNFTGLVRFTPDSGGDPPWISPESADRWRYFFELHRSGRATEVGVGPVQVDLVSRDGTIQTVSILWDRVVDNDRRVVAMLALVRPLPAGGESTDVDLTSLLAELTIVVGRLTAKAAQGREQPNGNGRSGSGVDDSSNGSTHAELSPRELEILASTLAGRRVSTTARELYLSEHTVRNHLKRIYRKMGVHSLAELRERHTPATVP